MLRYISRYYFMRVYATGNCHCFHHHHLHYNGSKLAAFSMLGTISVSCSIDLIDLYISFIAAVATTFLWSYVIAA